MNIPTFKPVILSHQVKKDGSVAVKIRVTHKRKVKYLPTSTFAQKWEYDKAFNLKQSVILRCADTMKEIDSIIGECSVYELDSMDIQDVVAYIDSRMGKKKKFKLEFFGWADQVVSKKPKYSAVNYRCALRSFEGFVGKSQMDIAEITSSLMRRYQACLEEKHGKDARAVSLYASSIAAIHAEARKMYNDNELGQVLIKNPFEYYTPPKQKPAKKVSLSRADIQKLIDSRKDFSGLDRLAIDTFLLSFATMGSNVPDLYYAVMNKPGVIYYQRTKTKKRRSDDAEMYIRLEPVAGRLFEEYVDATGERAFKFHNLYTFYKSIADKGNDRLKKVAEQLGIKPFSMRYARRSFGTIAASMGFHKSFVNDMLCHVDSKMAVTDIYIERDWSVLWDVNRKVLESFDWSKF